MTKSIWPKASSQRVAKALAGHSAIGLAIAALLYILTISGILSVFNHELQRWEQPAAPELAAISPDAVQKAAETVLQTEDKLTEHFFIQLPAQDMPRAVITTDAQAVFADVSGDIGAAEHHPWTQFVLDLHYYLHLPMTLGLTIVGLLGVMLLGAVLSGFLAHPRIFRDAFTFRFNGNDRLTQADLHNRIGVWTSPFIISSALTGAMLGLALIISMAIAQIDYGGDVEAVFEPVFGEDAKENDAPAPVADIAAALTYMQEAFPDTEPVYVILHEPMTAGQKLQILAEHPERLIFGDYYNFDADGAYLGNVGMADGTLGQQIAASAYRLHFGSYGGLPVKVAYALFGAALAFMISAGLNIYFLKRREKLRPAPKLEAMWAAVVWGAPAAMFLAMASSVAQVAPAASLPPVFWSGLALAILVAAILGDRGAVARCGRYACAGLLVLGLATHFAVNSSAFVSPAAIATSAFGLAAAAALLLPEWMSIVRRPQRSATTTPPRQPAE